MSHADRNRRTLLRASFPNLYAADIDTLLKSNGKLLYQTYFALERLLSVELPEPQLRTKKYPGGVREQVLMGNSEAEIMANEEITAAKAITRARQQAEAEKARREQVEVDNMNRAKADGAIADCECCCVEFALNRMVHCNGEVVHWFCYDCARRLAESQIGLNKYELTCMSTCQEGCAAGFSLDQRKLFLDDKTAAALNRIEQDAVLRMASLDSLAECPFCPYAAEYPPVEVDKEFRCDNPDCGIVSCRLCKKETHIPKSCKEAREECHSARHQIEEAMTEALIRICNKCKAPSSPCNPFVRHSHH